MAEGVKLAEVSVPVGQQVEVSLNVSSGAQDIFVLSCEQGDIVAPALADGTSLTWPHSVTIVDGVGTYYGTAKLLSLHNFGSVEIRRDLNVKR